MSQNAKQGASAGTATVQNRVRVRANLLLAMNMLRKGASRDIARCVCLLATTSKWDPQSASGPPSDIVDADEPRAKPSLSELQKSLQELTEAFSPLQNRLRQLHMHIQMRCLCRHVDPRLEHLLERLMEGLLKSLHELADVQGQLKRQLILITWQPNAQEVYTQDHMQQLLAELRAQKKLLVQLHMFLVRGQHMLTQAKVHDGHVKQKAASSSADDCVATSDAPPKKKRRVTWAAGTKSA